MGTNRQIVSIGPGIDFAPSKRQAINMKYWWLSSLGHVASGPRLSIYILSFRGMGIPMLKIRRSQECLIFKMGSSILVRLHLYIQMGPRGWFQTRSHHCIQSNSISFSRLLDPIWFHEWSCSNRITIPAIRPAAWTGVGLIISSPNFFLSCSVLC